jgi:phage N-6-adenine-methyltransferase
MGDVAQLPGAADRGSTNLPGLIDRARARLAEARTSAEVLEARAAAKAVLEYARLTKATREAHADCFLIIKYAEMRLVEEVRAGQERGELARHGGVRKSAIKVRTPDLDHATLDEIGISKQRFAEWSEVYDAGGTATIEEAVDAALGEGRAPTNADVQRAVKGGHYRTRFTGENEWYTPPQYIEAARACLGSIDLDPATAATAQKTIRAARFFTRDDDGLKQEWHGRIWLNPPYSQPDIARFIDKLLIEVNAGRATEAILLTHNYTDTGWFHAAAGQCAALCFTRGRIRFVGASGEIAAPTQGQAFFYFGPGLDRFRASFGSFGFIR